MKVLIDCLPRNAGGGSRTYVDNLVRNFTNDEKIEKFGLIVSDDSFDDLSLERFDIIKKPLNNNRLQDIIWISRNIKRISNEFGVYHGLKNYVPNFSGNSVVSILDLFPVIFPRLEKINNLKRELFRKVDLLYWKYIIPKSIKRSNKIITISENTKSDLIKIYNVPSNKIEVIYLGVDFEKFYKNRKTPVHQETFNMGYIGGMGPKKNLIVVLKAMSLLKIKPFFYIAGKITEYTSLLKIYIKELGLEKNVFFLGEINEKEKLDFYKKLNLFVYPSLYEGFGLPVLEAMASGLPVISSNSSSLSEVGGDAPLYFSPNDYITLSKYINELIINENLRKNMQKKGYLQAKKFSWEKTAKLTKKVYLGEI